MTHELWTNLNRRIQDYLAEVTLENLVAQQTGRVPTANVVHDHRRGREKASVAA
jgi:Rrf2 family iron-sulfur cluster assembly transcriptional regulator